MDTRRPIKLIPQVKFNEVECFAEARVTIGLNSRNREEFGSTITFNEVRVELARRNLWTDDLELRSKLLAFREARMDKLGNLYLFN